MKKFFLSVIFAFLPFASFAGDSSRIDELTKSLSEGSFEHYLKGWQYNCEQDKFNQNKSCNIYNYQADLSVDFTNGKHLVWVGKNHYPRSQSAVKIDENTPIYGNEGSSNTPLKVIEQMKKGKTAYTRYKEWPYEYNKDGEVDLTGFKEKYDEMLQEYKKL